MSRRFITKGVVLRHTDSGDSARIVTLFTQARGLLAGYAKGVRKSQRRFSGRMDLFSLVEVAFSQGRGELHSLLGADLLDGFQGIREDVSRIAWASFLSELVERLFGEGEAHPEVFDLLTSAFSYLSRSLLIEEIVLLAYELRFLSLAGLQPELMQCVACRERVGDGLPFGYAISRGGPLCDKCMTSGSDFAITADALGTLAEAAALPVDAFLTLRLAPIETRQARGLLRLFERYHLTHALKSESFLSECTSGELFAE